jgi:hypothetical protein
MLIYGDAEREVMPVGVRAAIAEKLSACERLRPGRARHEMLVRAFILTSELVQGLADLEFGKRGADDHSPVQAAGARLLLALANAVGRSWQNNLAGDLSSLGGWPQQLAALIADEAVRMRRGEGYAFYALYPESYFMAAQRSGLAANTVVIGLRSIGTGLAAMVAAGLGSPPAHTLRPIGHPFDRRLAITPELSGEILSGGGDYAVVDEGPGLSGSSFGCVADWLQAHGIDADRIHFFPSHLGDVGPQASERHRQRWTRSPRHVVSVDECILDAGQSTDCLQNWVRELVDAPIEWWRDISGGEWRKLAGCDQQLWPPSDRGKEKRKFLVSCNDQIWLVKFAGLGEESVSKARKGSILGEAGFSPGIIGLRYGFIIEHWMSGTRLDQAAFSKDHIIAAIGRYLGFRARRLSASTHGAPLQRLAEMAIFNSKEALDPEAASTIEALIGDVSQFEAETRPIDTDNRLHRWEWIVGADGRIIKTDALDHSAAHDLVGCQDVAWDIAGAAVEFDLSLFERDQLAKIVASEAGYETRPELIGLFEIFYLGFQTGLWTDAAASFSGDDACSTHRLSKRYVDRLNQLTKP